MILKVKERTAARLVFVCTPGDTLNDQTPNSHHKQHIHSYYPHQNKKNVGLGGLWTHNPYLFSCNVWEWIWSCEKLQRISVAALTYLVNLLHTTLDQLVQLLLLLNENRPLIICVFFHFTAPVHTQRSSNTGLTSQRTSDIKLKIKFYWTWGY